MISRVKGKNDKNTGYGGTPTGQGPAVYLAVPSDTAFLESDVCIICCMFMRQILSASISVIFGLVSQMSDSFPLCDDITSSFFSVKQNSFCESQ